MVLPGEFLSTGEEFAPGSNAFDCEGNVCSANTGLVSADSKTREISVKPVIELLSIKPGSIVLGRVTLVKENNVSIELCENRGKRQRQVISQTRAVIPIRNASREYVEKLRDCFKVGDIVKARVSKILPGGGIDLETNQPDLGVVKAFCSKCRHPLRVFGTSLRCLNCGSSEKRKTATGYTVK